MSWVSQMCIMPAVGWSGTLISRAPLSHFVRVSLRRVNLCPNPIVANLVGVHQYIPV